MEELVIRAAVVEDAPEVLELTKLAFTVYSDALGSSDIPVAALKETVEKTEYDIKNNQVFVATINGRLAGSIRYERLSSELAYIYRFAVDPNTNNTGIGSSLLDACTNDIMEKGFKAITLHTNSKFYKLARYYYGKQFYVHSTDLSKGYIRALFIKELGKDEEFDLTPAFKK